MILQAIKISNQFYLNNFNKIFQTCILSVVVVSALSANTPNFESNSYMLTVIISMLLQVHLTCMLMMVTSDIIKGTEQSTTNYYFKAIFYVAPLFVVGLVVGFGLLLGFAAFIIPGIFLLGKLIFAQYFLLLRGKNIFESLEMSWQMESGKAWNLGVVIVTMVLMWGLIVGTFSSYFVNDNNMLEPVAIFLTSIFNFMILNIYLNTFLIHLFIIEENNESF